MKVEHFNLLATCFTVVTVLSLSAPSRSQKQTHGNEAKSSRKKYDSGQLPVLIGRYIMITSIFACCHQMIFTALEHYFSLVHFVSLSDHWNIKVINDNLSFFFHLGSRDQDFVVKWRGEMLSWKNLSQLLHQHNITLPQEENVLAAVLQLKNSSVQSCQGRCFLNERRHDNKTCFCDKPCKLLSDCCLDFQTR